MVNPCLNLFYVVNCKVLMLKTCGFLPFLLFLFTTAVFSLSTYICTPSGRRTALSPRNPCARASYFGIIANKTNRGIDNSVPLLLPLLYICKGLGLKTCGFLPFLCFYLLLPFAELSAISLPPGWEGDHLWWWKEPGVQLWCVYLTVT